MSHANRLVGLLAGWLAVLVVVLVVGAGVAGAHADLVSTDPASKAVLLGQPTAVALFFTEAVDPVPGGIRLVRSDGSVVASGPVGRVGGADSTVELGVPLSLPEDTYVVSWRVISADAHPARGAFTFQVGEGARKSVGPLVERLLLDQGGRRGLGVLLAAGRWISVAGVVLSAGWLLFAASGLNDRVPTGAVAWAAGVGTVGTAIMIGAQAVNQSGSWASLLSPQAYAEVFTTRAGTWWVARTTVLALLSVAAALLRRTGPWGPIAALALVTVTACGGHAVTGRWVAVGLVATVAHLVALGLWASGLVTLARGRGIGLGEHGRVGFARRFTPYALGSLAVLVASGAVNALRQAGSPDSLLGTDYGRLLLVKLAGVAGLVVVAAIARRASRRSDGNGLIGPALAEVALIALVLSVTVVLVNVRPGLTETRGPLIVSAVVGERTAQVVLDPARASGSSLHVYLSSARGALDRATQITVTATLPAQDIGPLPLEVFSAGPNHVTGPHIVLALAGDWVIEVTARYGEFEQVRFRTTMTVHK